MTRAVDGTYELPTNSVSPAVASTTIDPDDFNTVMTDLETAVSDTVYTSAGLGSTDNRLPRTDGTNGKVLQGSAIAVDDSGNMSGMGYIDIGEIAAPGSPASNTARLYCVDSAGTTKLAYKDAAGTITTIDASGGGGGSSLAVQVFTSSGTYTPTSGMTYCIIECVGGGGGAGSASFSSGFYVAGGSGGAGSYSRLVATAATIGASKTVTIGAAGSGGTAAASPGNAGTAGGDTSVGSLCIGKGGSGGSAGTVGGLAVGGNGGVAGTGDLTATGESGSSSTILSSAANALGSQNGASSPWGGGGKGAGTDSNGNAGTGYGAGGSSGNALTANKSGGAGSAGAVIITEYL
jgi:hypothetical protein